MIKEIDLERPQGRHHLRSALHDGVFLVRNTVAESLLDEAYGFLSAFFALTPEQKRTCRVPGSNGQSGYTPPLAEHAEVGPVADFKELFHWGAALPAGHPLRVRTRPATPTPTSPTTWCPASARHCVNCTPACCTSSTRWWPRWPARWASTPTTSATCSRTAPPSTGPPGTRRWSRPPPPSMCGRRSTRTST